MKILVVEDDAALLESFLLLLEGQGHHVVGVSDLETAFYHLRPGLDCIVADGLLPTIGGGKFLASWGLLLLLYAKFVGTPGILISGNAAIVDEARQAGIPAMLKPVTIEDLLQMIAKATGRG